MMPGVDGFELLRSLRADPQTREVPLILLSARAGEEARIEGLEAGADDYLIKPFSARELLARVESTLKIAVVRQEATQREKVILERITDAFVAYDRDFHLIYLNPAAERSIQITAAAAQGKTLWEISPDLIGTLFEARLKRALAEQTPTQFEAYYPVGDRWIESHVYPSPTGLSVYCRDVSDRKRVEAALQESEEKYRALIDLSPQVVWMSDSTGQLPSAISTCWTTRASKWSNWRTIAGPTQKSRLNNRWASSRWATSGLQWFTLTIAIGCCRSGVRLWLQVAITNLSFVLDGQRMEPIAGFWLRPPLCAMPVDKFSDGWAYPPRFTIASKLRSKFCNSTRNSIDGSKSYKRCWR